MSSDASPADVVYFNKYDARGAYHWQECDRRSASFNPPLLARYEVVRRQVAEVPHRGRAIDIGCGDAYLIAQIQDMFNEIIGVDPEPRAVQLANEILSVHPHCRVVQGDCYRIPVNDHSVDVALLTDVIEHLKKPQDCLKEIRRVLKDDGVMILTTPKFRPDRKWDECHEKEFTAEELRNLLQTVFMRVEVSFFWPLKWSNFYRTRVGWRLCKYLARWGWNPFLNESSIHPETYGQLKAVCSGTVG